MDTIFVTVIAATLAQDAQRAALQDPQDAPERRGWGRLLRQAIGPPAEPPRFERRAPAPAR